MMIRGKLMVICFDESCSSGSLEYKIWALPSHKGTVKPIIPEIIIVISLLFVGNILKVFVKLISTLYIISFSTAV